MAYLTPAAAFTLHLRLNYSTIMSNKNFNQRKLLAAMDKKMSVVVRCSNGGGWCKVLFEIECHKS